MLPFLIPLLMSGASFLGGALANRKKTSTSTSMPTLDPSFGPLQSMLLKNATDRLQNPVSLAGGPFETGGTANINKTFDIGKQSLENVLTARGLGTSPVAGSALARHETGRIGAIAGFRSNIPLWDQERQQQDMQSALQLLGQGRGNTNTLTSPGNVLGGGLEGLAQMLGFLMGQGAFAGKSGSTGSSFGL